MTTQTPTLGRRSLAAAMALPILAIAGSSSAQSSSAQSSSAQSSSESTFERVRRTKTLRIAVLPGELPYFQKDLATSEWSGACIAMANDIAKVFDAKLEYVESTYGNSVLDLQSNKVDLAFALNPTPARALSIGFTHPMIIHPFGCLSTAGKNPSLGPYHLLGEPTVALPSCLGVQREPDTRFREVVDAWLDMNRGNGQIREWLLEGLAKFGVTRDQVPTQLSF